MKIIFLSFIFDNFPRWFERWKERNQIHFSFGQWLPTIEDCCALDAAYSYEDRNHNGNVNQNESENDFVVDNLKDPHIVEDVCVESNEKNYSQITSKAHINNPENNNSKISERVSSIHDVHKDVSTKAGLSTCTSAVDAAMLAGKNAVNISRNSKKGFALLQGNKVRKACLRIPLVYSYRTQRLPPVSTCNTRTEDKNDNSMIIVGVDKGKVEIVNTEENKCDQASYYFPCDESEEWLCVYRK